MHVHPGNEAVVQLAENCDGALGTPEAPSGHYSINLGSDSLSKLTDYALIDAVLGGALPHGWGTQGPAPVMESRLTPEDLSGYFPADAAIIRSVTLTDSVEVVAQGTDFLAHLFRSEAWFMLRIAAASPALARAVAASIQAAMPAVIEETKESGVISVRTWHPVQGTLRSKVQDVTTHAWPDVADHYTATTRRQLEQLVALRPGAKAKLSGRIVLLTGEPGVGKTSAIRVLAREWSDWCIFEEVQHAERVLNDPEMLGELTTALPPSDYRRDDPRTHRALVLEDVDHFLRVANGSGDPAIGRILNMADGWTGTNKLLLVMTSNLMSRHMHPALIRPGRCLADIRFGKLSPAEAKKVIGDNAPSPAASLSLAEAFELRCGADVARSDDHFTPTGYL